MIGVDAPSPGICTFQRTLLVSLHFSGGSACGATPFSSGPRHCGQFSSDCATTAAGVTQEPMTAATANKLRNLTARTPLKIECNTLPLHSLRLRRPVCTAKITPKKTIYYLPMQ